MNNNSTSNEKSFFYGWFIVWACFFLNLYVGAVTFFGFTVFFEPIQQEFAWSHTQISLASSLRGFEMGILAPIVGILVDRFGPRKITFVGVAFMSAGLLLLSRIQSLPMFYWAIILLSFGSGGCTSVVSMTAVASWFHKKLGLALGITASGFGASGLLIPVIVCMTDHFGWRMTLVLLTMGMLAVGLPAGYLIRKNEKNNIRHKSDLPDSYEKPDIPFLNILKLKPFWYINIMEISRMMAVSAISTHVMPYLTNLGFERSFAGKIAAAIPVISIVGRFGLGWLSDFMNKCHVQIINFILLTTGLFIFCFFDFFWAMLFFLCTFPIGLGGSMVLRGSLLSEFFGTASFGKLMGIVFGSAAIGGIAGPTVAGWIFDTTGSYTPAWILIGSIMGITIILVSRLRPEEYTS